MMTASRTTASLRTALPPEPDNDHEPARLYAMVAFAVSPNEDKVCDVTIVHGSFATPDGATNAGSAFGAVAIYVIEYGRQGRSHVRLLKHFGAIPGRWRAPSIEALISWRTKV